MTTDTAIKDDWFVDYFMSRELSVMRWEHVLVAIQNLKASDKTKVRHHLSGLPDPEPYLRYLESGIENGLECWT